MTMRKAMLVAILLLVGCKKKASSSEEDINALGALIRGGGLRHEKDPTGRCYAYGYVIADNGNATTGGPIFTWEPCKDAPAEARP